MTQPNFCTGCGEKLGTNDRFCASCGNQVTITSSEPEPATSEPEPATTYEPSSQSSKALIYLVNLHSFEGADWARRINIATKGLEALKPHYQTIVNAQIGTTPDDLLPYSLGLREGLIRSALPIQLPKISSLFDTEQKREQLREYLTEVLELGCLMTMPFFGDIPPDVDSGTNAEMLLPEEITDTFYSLFLDSAEDIFKLQWAPRGLGPYAKDIERDFGKVPTQTWGRFSIDRVSPFYKSHGVKSGFMMSNIGKPVLHSRALFYVGASLGIHFQLALRGEFSRALGFDSNS